MTVTAVPLMLLFFIQSNKQRHWRHDTRDLPRISLGHHAMGAVLSGVTVSSYLGPRPAAHKRV